jgi:Spy/CpxP family protein refolding chaperone
MTMPIGRQVVRVVLVAALMAGTAAGLHAQVLPPERGRSGAPRLNDAQRLQMERRLEERINKVVRERLALTDEQFDKMREVARRVEQERRVLRSEEMSTRFALRRELLAGDRANESTVAELLDRMPQYERRRLDLMEREQRELAKFLSPTQRAKYIGVQDELRRTMQEVQRRRMDVDTSAGAAPRGMRRSIRPPGGV